MRIGEVLLKEQKITPEQLTHALHIQRQFKMRLGSVFIEGGIVDEDAVARALSKLARVPAVLRKHFEAMDRASASKVPARIAAQLFCIPLGYTPSTPPRFLVACRDPATTHFDEIAFIAGARVEPGIASESVIRRELERVYGIKNEPRFVVSGSGRSSTVKQAFMQAKKASEATTLAASQRAGAGAGPISKKSALSAPPPPVGAPSVNLPGGGHGAPSGMMGQPNIQSANLGAVARARKSLTMPNPVMAMASPDMPMPPAVGASIPASALMDPNEGTEAHLDFDGPSTTPQWAPESLPSAGGFDISIPPTTPVGPNSARMPMPAALQLIQDQPSEQAATAPSPPPEPMGAPAPVVQLQMPSQMQGQPLAVTMQSMPGIVVPPPQHVETQQHQSPQSSSVLIAAPALSSVQMPVAAPAGEELKAWAPSADDIPAPELRMPIDAAQALDSMKTAVSRDQICNDLVDYLLSMGPIALIFIVKDDMILGWKGHVEGVNPSIFETIMYPCSAPSFFKNALDARAPFCGEPPPEGSTIQTRLWKVLKQEAPAQVMCGPIMIKDRVVNLLYTHPRKGERFIPRDVAEMTNICKAASVEYLRLIKSKTK